MRKLLVNIDDKDLFFDDLWSFYELLSVLKRINKRVPNTSISALVKYSRLDFDLSMLCDGRNIEECKEFLAQELVSYFSSPEVMSILSNNTSLVAKYLKETDVSYSFTKDFQNYLTSHKSNPLLEKIEEYYSLVFNVSFDQLIKRLMYISVLLHQVLVCQRDWNLNSDDIYEVSTFKLITDLKFYYLLSKTALKTPKFLDSKVKCIDPNVNIEQLIEEYNTKLKAKQLKSFESSFLPTEFKPYEDPELYDYLSKLYLEFSFEM